MPSGDEDHTKKDWLRSDFDPWEEPATGRALEEASAPSSSCKVVLRCRQAKTPWECVVRAVVGEPVHVDTVLARDGSPSARFCYSSYMSQKFEMNMMPPELVMDDCMKNFALDVTEEEHERCTKFLTALEGKAAYSYFDAMVLMPMAPKPYDSSSSASSLGSGNRLLSTVFNVLAEDQESTPDPEKIKKVFCSQSVVLMLRYALDPNGKHSELLKTLSGLNSRLVSPRQVQHVLEAYGAQPLSNEELARL